MRWKKVSSSTLLELEDLYFYLLHTYLLLEGTVSGWEYRPRVVLRHSGLWLWKVPLFQLPSPLTSCWIKKRNVSLNLLLIPNDFIIGSFIWEGLLIEVDIKILPFHIWGGSMASANKMKFGDNPFTYCMWWKYRCALTSLHVSLLSYEMITTFITDVKIPVKKPTM